ncbi:MAG: hypothetical protein ACJ8BC_03105 [Gemmatimonadales bacterium]
MRTILFVAILAVVAIGTDAVLYNGAYSQAAWRTLSQYTLELRGPSDQTAPEAPAENRPGTG